MTSYQRAVLKSLVLLIGALANQIPHNVKDAVLKEIDTLLD